MQETKLEVGAIFEGKVTGITKFGAFVDIGGKTGMVHISEVAPVFVKEITDFPEFWHTEPVEFLLDDGSLDAGQQKFILGDFSEIEKVYVDFQPYLLSPGEYVILKFIKVRLFYIYYHIDC
jgi:polyribonucleotide nucleotidyltransferase